MLLKCFRALTIATLVDHQPFNLSFLSGKNRFSYSHMLYTFQGSCRNTLFCVSFYNPHFFSNFSENSPLVQLMRITNSDPLPPFLYNKMFYIL